MNFRKQPNQYTNAPPFCDFLERYQAAMAPKWTKSQLLTQRVGMRRFDQWLTASGIKLSELNWQKLHEFHRFLTTQGVSFHATRRSIQMTKHALRWGIEQGELPQKHSDIYTSIYPKNKWDQDLPALSENFIEQVAITHPGAARTHRNAHCVFHHFLKEKKLSYRRLRQEHIIALVKYTKQKDFSPRSQATICLKVRTYLRWLHENRKIARHPDNIFPTRFIPKVPKTLPRPLEPELDARMQKLLIETNDIYYKSIILLRRTGIRISELRKLEFDCIEYDQKRRAQLKVPPVKLGIEHRVPLDQDTIALIERIQQMSCSFFKKSSTPPKLVIGHTGTPPRYEPFSAAMAEICAKLNTNKWVNLHTLRHTFATSMLNAGLSITSLKEILGHKTINMTLVYAKVTQEKIHSEFLAAMSKMNEARIPELLIPKKIASTDDLFTDLAKTVTRKLDDVSDKKEQKKIKAILNRISKLKSELGKIP